MVWYIDCSACEFEGLVDEYSTYQPPEYCPLCGTELPEDEAGEIQ